MSCQRIIWEKELFRHLQSGMHLSVILRITVWEMAKVTASLAHKVFCLCAAWKLSLCLWKLLCTPAPFYKVCSLVATLRDKSNFIVTVWSDYSVGGDYLWRRLSHTTVTRSCTTLFRKHWLFILMEENVKMRKEAIWIFNHVKHSSFSFWTVKACVCLCIKQMEHVCICMWIHAVQYMHWPVCTVGKPCCCIIRAREQRC